MPAAPSLLDDRAGAIKADPRLIIPLDLPTRADAEAMVERLGEAVSFYKIGLQLLAGGGMDMAKDLKRRGRQVFLDWKLHDIGATVEKATAAIVATGACDVLTVHAEPQVMAAAARGRAGAPGVKIVGVTVLTSLNDADLAELGYGLKVEALVERRIRQAIDAGLDGVVASPHEAAMARRIGGPGFLVITPGVRPAWAKADDQARAATPAEALSAGASHLVCGRPITAANDPRAAALQVAQEIAGV
jgi:orotidine-5'-phosphate decarboxylase